LKDRQTEKERARKGQLKVTHVDRLAVFVAHSSTPNKKQIPMK